MQPLQYPAEKQSSLSCTHAKETYSLRCKMCMDKWWHEYCERLEITKYLDWLKTPKISPTVPELIQSQKSLFQEIYQLNARLLDEALIKQAKIQRRNMITNCRNRVPSPKRLKYSDKKKLKDSVTQCAYCLKPMDRKESVIDHIIASCLDGEDDINNIVVCCHKCNSKKGVKSYGQWIMSLPPELRQNAKDIYLSRYKTLSFQEF